ncbi:MAG: HTH-type transcriptional repressor YvoA [Steroidobacteraceae bacterium]|nr:HTH-type transcriptional repressor YvoA [Steroidobacteraceae bacterium]
MSAALHAVADSPSPRYYQVYVTLRAWVRDGTYGPGAQIPTEAELCRLFGVSRITVRKALADLVREGWLVRHQGRGTFVELSSARAPVSVDLGEALHQIVDLGAATEVRDSRVSVVRADDETLAALDLEPGTRVQKVSRVRVLRGVPLAQITTFVPLDVAAMVGHERAAEHMPMFELLERSGIRVREADQWLGATLANVESGRALAVGIGAPLLRLTRIVYDTRRRPVERVVALYRADAYQYRMHLKRARGA